METGLMVEPQVGGTYAELLELAQWAEHHGFDSFARSDHYMNMATSASATDALTTFGGLARETERIKLTVLVTPLTFRHPAVLAKTAGTLHEMSGGRFELGVGTGWMEPEHETFGLELPQLGRRFDRFEEALGYLWAAFGRADGGYSGDYFTLGDVAVLPRVGDGAPIIIGGSGMKRTPTLAGTYADEYNMFVTTQETLDARVTVMREAAIAAGRSPEAIKVSMAVSPIVGDDESDYQDQLRSRAVARGLEPDAYAERLTEAGVPHGTSDEVVAKFAEIASWGVDRVYLQSFSALHEVDTERLGKTAAQLRSM
jgi:alkanesulfonate monooxygenase SsuD/methylene tetrahydromethanopterin reductase-like flavin-dependent oxidoreductase (luciferase family)